MLEQTMVQYGAPTLAGLKTGSLFSVHAENPATVAREVERIDRILQPKGVRLTIMKHGDRLALLYLYREAQLKQCLACPNAQEMLTQCGYCNPSVDDALNTLRKKLADQENFPHEIGLFLGYPLSDVTEFMRHYGKKCLLSGCWKVYSEEAKAIRTFEQYRRCKKLYSKRFHTGTPFIKLTVATKSA